MKAVVARTVAQLLTSKRVRAARRSLASVVRRTRGAPAVVHYFHQADDPYGHLVLQVLPALAANYAIRLAPHVVPPPDDAAAPDRPRLEAWSRRDAADLAAASGLEFDDPGTQPDAALVSLANRVLAKSFEGGRPTASALDEATTASRALWRGNEHLLGQLSAATPERTSASLDAGAALRRRLGHYLGATLYFEGEWYWGVDRLRHLEERLRAAGLARAAAAPWIVQLPGVGCRHRPTNGHRPALHFYCSLRSPYTWLAVERVVRLAECYDARLMLRFVLPMVMRGLPVPREKRLYILRDAKREAESLGLPFGRIVDPVGVPTERGLAVLHRAIGAGQGLPFLQSFMRGVWAEGIDAGSDAGLLDIARRAGLDDAFVAGALADDSWRAVAQANREEMLGLGLWGVPSFRVDANPARWGQDRLWQVERDLIAATQAAPTEPQAEFELPRVGRVLRTPESRFASLPQFPYRPRWTEVGGLRIAHVDEGPPTAAPVLLMHGEPTWSFLYRKMIPVLVGAGHRVVVPDLVGFGRSDKPADIGDYSYLNHVKWMSAWLVANDLRGITLFCQDWGSLIGLRMAAGMPERFARIVIGNGGLPTGATPMPRAFRAWRAFARWSPWFPIGRIVNAGCVSKLGREEIAAYDAPFPDRRYRTAARLLPGFVPAHPEDPERANNERAWEVFKRWDKPLLTLFSSQDPITRGGDRIWQALVPGARGQPHATIRGAGHFLQEDKGAELAEAIAQFIRATPRRPRAGEVAPD